MLAQFRQRRPNRLDFAVKPPGKPAIDNLGTVDVRDPDVAVAIDPDPGIVGNQWYPMRVDPIALKPHPIDGRQ